MKELIELLTGMLRWANPETIVTVGDIQRVDLYNPGTCFPSLPDRGEEHDAFYEARRRVEDILREEAKDHSYSRLDREAILVSHRNGTPVVVEYTVVAGKSPNRYTSHAVGRIDLREIITIDYDDGGCNTFRVVEIGGIDYSDGYTSWPGTVKGQEAAQESLRGSGKQYIIVGTRKAYEILHRLRRLYVLRDGVKYYLTERFDRTTDLSEAGWFPDWQIWEITDDPRMNQHGLIQVD